MIPLCVAVPVFAGPMWMTDLKDPLLKSRTLAQVEVINKIDETLTERIYDLPYLPQENTLPGLLEFYDTRQSLTTK